MRVVEYHTNTDIRIVDLPSPEIGPGELLVKLHACGIDQSDVTEWYTSPRAPLYPGHEPAGVVVAVGAGVHQFSVGQRVFMHHRVPCMVCHFCQRSSFSQCPEFRTTRLYPGGLAEYIRVPAPNVHLDVLPLPDEVSFEAATLIEPLACCVRGIQRSSLHPGDTVCILGAGSNSLMLGLLAQQQSAGKVMLVDPMANRRQHALAVGIDFALDPCEAPLLQQIKALNAGHKPDVVIVTSGEAGVMKRALDLVGPGGTVLFFVPPPPAEMLEVNTNHLFFQEISLRTSYSAGPYETRQALDLLRNRRIRAETIITHRFVLHNVAEAFQLVATPSEAVKVIITTEQSS